MAQPLPISNFAEEDVSNFNKDNIMLLPDDGQKGYYFKVDAHIPEELHDYFSDYPLMPEQKVITDDMLSELQLNIKEKLKLKHLKERIIDGTDNVPKLICDLTDKHEYLIHYRMLKLCIELGVEITKIHSCYSFNQKAWMKEYIDKNVEFRAKAKTKFEEELHKLAMNSVYGKQIENVRKRVNIDLIVNNEQKLKKILSSPVYGGKRTIFSDDIVAVHKRKMRILLNKPIIVGSSILDLSKLEMYNFWYKTLKNKYQDKIKLLFTDTDSLCFIVETEDFYKDMKCDKDMYDFSGYFEGHFLYDSKNRKKLGCMKDETCGIPITEFVGLKAKMYSLMTETFDNFNNNYYKIHGNFLKEPKKKPDVHKMTCKGIKKSVCKKEISHNDFVSCNANTDEPIERNHTIKLINSKKHQLYSIEQSKKGINCMDKKRFILDSNIDTLPFGHFKIKNIKH